MINAQRILDECRAMSSYQLVPYAKEHMQTVYNYLTVFKKINRSQAIAAILECVCICVALDGYFNDGEWQFLKKVFDLSEYDYNTIRNQVSNATTIRIKRDASEFCKSFPYLQRKALISLCMATMCADGRFTYEDLDFLEDCLLG